MVNIFFGLLIIVAECALYVCGSRINNEINKNYNNT